MELLNKFRIKLSHYFNLIINNNPHSYFTFLPLKIYEFKELMRNIRFIKNDTVLDLGCGDGLLTIIIGRKCKKIIGIDISSESIKKAKTLLKFNNKKVNCEFRPVSIEKACFKKEYFDKIISICVLEHIKNYVYILKEIYSTLKYGGQFIFTVDSLENIDSPKLISLHKKRYKVENYFNSLNLKKKIESIGFKNISIKPICKSKYAKKLLIKGFAEDFNFSRLFSSFNYFLLKLSEKHSKNKNKNKGLFLLINYFK